MSPAARQNTMPRTLREIGQSLFPAPGSEEVLRPEEGVLDLLGGTPRKTLRSDTESLEAHARSAATGDPQAQYELAKLLLTGKPLSIQNREAAKWLRKASAREHAASEALLGLLYARGQGVHPNPERAVELFRTAAIAGNASAQYHLGIALENGFGCAKDPRSALSWHRLAGAQGHVLAQLRVGQCYAQGIGCRRDPVQAQLWLRGAAVQAYPEAELALGVFFSAEDNTKAGDGEQEAFQWISRAASDGLPEAQYRLALLYSIGRGCPASASQAVSWARAAASRGHTGAMLFLASCLRHGEGVLRDLAGALALTQRVIAETDGHLGRGAMEEIEALASAAERAEAQQLLKDNETAASLVATILLRSKAPRRTASRA